MKRSIVAQKDWLLIKLFWESTGENERDLYKAGLIAGKPEIWYQICA